MKGSLRMDYSLPRRLFTFIASCRRRLSNVTRHSGAREAWVTLGEKDNQLDLEIRDNGSGFEARPEMKRAAGQGIGLMGMRERAEHLQGSLSIRSAPHKGTTVRVRIPLQRPSLQSRPEEIN